MTDCATMEAGPEIDALAAEMLGWKAYKERRGQPGNYYELCVARHPGRREPWLDSRPAQPERYTRVPCVEAQRIGWFGAGFPKFSTDPAAANELLDKLLADGWGLHFSMGKLEMGSGELRVSVELRTPRAQALHYYDAEAPTWMLALCHAALMAQEEAK